MLQHALYIFSFLLTCRKDIILPTCFFSKKGNINFVPKSVHACVGAYMYTALMSLVDASPPKPLDKAPANFEGA